MPEKAFLKLQRPQSRLMRPVTRSTASRHGFPDGVMSADAVAPSAAA
ncbi:hypothetical protein IG631_20519 [Alternaria alternata]|nr:hypothetical protein IG631_20519 [Alternaria alternata]